MPILAGASTEYRTRLLTIEPTHYLHNYNWFSDQQSRDSAKEAMQFLAKAENHGLNPQDYQLTLLQQAFEQPNEANTQFINNQLTTSLLLLIHDLKQGRFDPKLADPDWYIEQEQFDVKAFLSHALLSKHLFNHLILLLPKDSEYSVLTQALIDYRRHADNNNWPTVPATPMLRPGDKHPNITIIQARLAAEDRFFALTHTVPSDYYDSLMEQAVVRFQTQYRLKVDGIIGPETQQVMNISAKDRVKQIKMNLERRRWLPDDLGSRYILVNLANFSLSAVDKNSEKLSMKVIVGRKSRQTPSFSSQLSHMVFNPYWNVPKKLARLDLLPKQQQDPNYFLEHDIRVFSTDSGTKVEQDPYSIDWHSYSRSRSLPYTLRQDPGPHNALGKIKFMFPNRWRIYLHDTPQKSLLNKHRRTFSSGCIRVEQPIELANFILPNPDDQFTIAKRIASKQNRGLKLNEPVNIFAVYFTVSVVDNQVLFSPDVYQRDERIIKLLY